MIDLEGYTTYKTRADGKRESLEFHKSDVKLVDDFWGLEACEEACNAKEECAGFEVVRYYKDVRGNQLNPTESYCSFLDRLSFDCERDNGFYVDHGMQTWCFKKPNEPKVPIDPQLAAQKCVAACPMWEEHSECFRDNVFCTVTEKCKDRAAELLCCLFEEQAETCADAVKYMEDPDGGAGGLWAMPTENKLQSWGWGGGGGREGVLVCIYREISEGQISDGVKAKLSNEMFMFRIVFEIMYTLLHRSKS